MTEKRPDADITWEETLKVLHFCYKVLRKLGLYEWRIGVAQEASEEGATANVDAPVGRYMASVHVCVGWNNIDIPHKRAVLVHEMLHLLHMRTAKMVEAVVVDQTDLSTDRSETIMTALRLGNEYMVDHLTTLFMETPGWTPQWPSLKEAQAPRYTNTDPQPALLP